MEYNLYKDDLDNFIPDVELVKVEGDAITRRVWFLWRGTEQWLEMSKDNQYGDFSWVIVDNTYTDEFDEWLNDNLENYDSLEFMFDLSDVIPTEYEITFKKENN